MKHIYWGMVLGAWLKWCPLDAAPCSVNPAVQNNGRVAHQCITLWGRSGLRHCSCRRWCRYWSCCTRCHTPQCSWRRSLEMFRRGSRDYPRGTRCWGHTTMAACRSLLQMKAWCASLCWCFYRNKRAWNGPSTVGWVKHSRGPLMYMNNYL